MEHWTGIASGLSGYDLDGLLITSAPGEFYAAGFHGEGTALVTGEGCWYFTDSRYIEAAGRQILGAEVVPPEPGKGCRGAVSALVQRLGLKRLGFEEAYMPVREHLRWREALTAELVPASGLLADLRMVKDADELAVMREAQRITDDAFREICNDIRPGLTEREVAARLQYLLLRMGAERMSFDPIVAAGANGSMPHAVPGDAVLAGGQLLTMDFGCVYRGYCSDMTRTVAIGRPTEEMERVYDTVLRAQRAGIAAARPGATGAQVHAAAAEVIAQAGYGPYFGHGLGHSLGIEIHESPRFSPSWPRPIPAGAVLSVEPGIYLPGRLGVRIEDVVVLEGEGCVDLTRSPKELLIL